jgi:hypothetical protein
MYTNTSGDACFPGEQKEYARSDAQVIVWIAFVEEN